jgi:aldehyde dehydrogenase (NAD+)
MSSCQNTPQDEIIAVILALRETFQSQITLSYEWRIKQLKRLQILVKDPSLSISLYNDLHRSQFESHLLELDLISEEIQNAINNLKKWMTPTKKTTNFSNFPGSSYIKHDPIGPVLIMSPWNYPLLLTFKPLVGAIAAGCTVLLRPASYSSNVSKTIFDLVDKIFNDQNDYDNELVSKFYNKNEVDVYTSTMEREIMVKGQDGKLTKLTLSKQDQYYQNLRKKYRPNLPIYVLLGDRDVTDFVLNQQFSYIFFTGGPQLGKIVLSKAARYLTPCTIELGGKSPAIIDNSVGDLHVVVKRLIWSAFLNSGQTCVRPDYCFIHQDIYDDVIELMGGCIRELYCTHRNPTQPIQNQQLSSISRLINNTSSTLFPCINNGDIYEYHIISKDDKMYEPNPPISSQYSLPVKTNYQTIPSQTIQLDKNGQNVDELTTHPHYSIPNTPYFGRIVNQQSFDRLCQYLRQDSSFIQHGGLIEEHTRFISPTILSFSQKNISLHHTQTQQVNYNNGLSVVSNHHDNILIDQQSTPHIQPDPLSPPPNHLFSTFFQSASMQDEIFGPILPCVPFKDINDVITCIRQQPRPLALYCFTNNEHIQDRIQNQTSSGSLVFNDAIVQLSNHNLPFGGVGYSGYGRYSGVYSFETFSHSRAVLKKGTNFDVPVRYPPYSNIKRNTLHIMQTIEGVKDGIVARL